MTMLTAAFDCSSDKSEQFFVMAGFVSSAEEWANFDKEWRARLKMDNLAYFHMHPFAHATTHPQRPFDKTWIGKESEGAICWQTCSGSSRATAGENSAVYFRFSLF
jgi:hypothetical protein